MPRKARIRCKSSTSFYHVILRGNNRKYIFGSNQHKLNYYELLCEQEKLGRIELAAWCIMDNHIHVILKADIKDMSVAFKSINIKFAQRYNMLTGSVGHVYDCRFMSKPIETDTYLLQSVRYVHNNPVHAKMVIKPADYSWSSYKVFTQYATQLFRPQMNFIMKYFDYCSTKFENWHTQDDDEEHLDIKEDLMRFYESRASRLIKTYAHKYGVTDHRDFERSHDIMNLLIRDIKRTCHIPLRRISSILELPYSRVQRANATKTQQNNIY